MSENCWKKKRKKKNIESSGNLISHPTNSPKGKYIGSIKKSNINIPKSHDIAVIPTINSAAMNEENRRLFDMNQNKSLNDKVLNDKFKKDNIIKIRESNIHIKKREGKSSYLIIFCIDASGSMGVKDRMKYVKSAIFSILQQNYINRDKVSLIIFRQNKAEVILQPTRSPDLAYKMLKEIPTGGTTPLVAGLIKSLGMAKEEIKKNTGYIPLILLLTDARGNVYYKDSIQDVLDIGYEIAKSQIETIIIDTESSDVKLEISKKIAEVTNATYYHIEHISENSFNQILTNNKIINVSQGSL